ncbi:MAG: hypothetical protein LUD72_10225 [Bacteroidales bacterium]|nr:hypothetical protein [Bacteroidales bacterium]
MADHTSFRVRTELNQTTPTVLSVALDQTYDTIDILSLKLNQVESYKLFESGFGVICGRVSCSGFGIPNAKVGVFVEMDATNTDLKDKIIYPYSSTSDSNYDSVQFNLLPNFVDDSCHATVGTFPNKRQWLDSPETTVQIYEKYYQFTTTSGPSGDFMIICPSGDAILHCDVDLSDIGTRLSQTPVDMQAKGYPANLFDSPTKFKKSNNLRELSQIYSQDKGLYVYPYWGEQTEYSDHIAITRADFDISYKLETYCVFMGGAVTDKGNTALNENCKAAQHLGDNGEIAATSGTLSMIRKTPSGRVEQYQIMGDQLIDNDGVWCYQIPMNLDYVMTDEFGNLVPTDDPDKGIATRARVRFRFTLNDTEEDGTARKRSSYLVPNNPRIDSENYPNFTETLEPDYEFGSLTAEESFKDLFWNNVYTVKNYIPKLQVSDRGRTRHHTGIKWTNFSEDNNPFPYNGLIIKRSIVFTVICVLTKFIIGMVAFLNGVISLLGEIPCYLTNIFDKMSKTIILGFLRPFAKIFDTLTPKCIGLGSDFCDDEVNRVTYYPGCLDCVWKKTQREHKDSEWAESDYDVDEYAGNMTTAKNKRADLMTCIENSLAQENEITSFNFANDWINGTLYFPMWYRKIKKKKSFLFGLIKRKAKDRWCNNDKNFGNLRLHQTCKIEYTRNGHDYNNFNGEKINPYWDVAYSESHKFYDKKNDVKGIHGINKAKETMLGETIYYYVPLEYDYSLSTNDHQDKNVLNGEVKLLFATDIVLLGNLKECNMYGIPQFFKNLESTTFNLPNDILDTDTDVTVTLDNDGNPVTDIDTSTTETGCDWGNRGSDQCKDYNTNCDGGLFYGIGCTKIEMVSKSCLNLLRSCEFGVSKDVVKTIENLDELSGNENSSGDDLIPDGYISYDELGSLDERAMFATMNANSLRTKLDPKNGLYRYDFHYLYPENFDGSLQTTMQKRQKHQCSANYNSNFNLEDFSQDYYNFRMGERPYFYNVDGSKRSFPRYENSFYFFFGLKEGKTALNKFNEQFFAPCEDLSGEVNRLAINPIANDWCSEISTDESDRNGYVEIDASGLETPYDIILNSTTNKSVGFEIKGLTDERVVICNQPTYAMLTDQETGDPDYEYANPESCQFNVPNGDYEITVTDGNGNITSATFSLKSKYLEFKTEVTDFNTGNNTMLSESGSYDEIANKDGDTYGGTIKVYAITWNNEPLDCYRVTLYCDSILYNYPSYTYCKCGSGSAYENSSGSGVVSTNGSDGEVVFAVPWGNTKYTIVVTQLCCSGGDGSNAIDSNNSVSTDVHVNKAEDYRFYINDIDYSLISHWNSGVANNNAKSSGQAVSGWLAMSKKASYNWGSGAEAEQLVEDLIDALAGWEGVTMDDKEIGASSAESLTKKCDNLKWDFSSYINNCTGFLGYIGIKGYDNLDSESQTDLCNEIADLLQTFDVYQQETIEDVKDAFWLVCEGDTKDLTLSASGAENQYPFSFRAWGRLETDAEVEEGEDSRTTLANAVTNPEYLAEDTSEEVSYVSPIGIPTLTTQDSVRFGNTRSDTKLTPPEDDTNGYFADICMATDNLTTFNLNRSSRWKRALKFPYSVAVMDVNGKTLPSAVGTNFDTIKYSKIGDFFVVHFIDKIMRYELVIWSAFRDIPKYRPTDSETCPVVNLNGLLAGIMRNGISTSVDGYGEVTFEVQTLGTNNLRVFNIKLGDDYEDAMPTTRVLATATDDMTDGFVNYKTIGDDEVGNNTLRSNTLTQCVAVPYKTNILEIGDDSCDSSVSVYGSFHIDIQDAQHDCRSNNNNNGALYVTASGGSGGDVTYYIFVTSGGNTYPLNSAEIDYDSEEECTDVISARLDMTDSNMEWTSSSDSRAIFSYYTTEDTLLNMCDKNCKGYSLKENSTSSFNTQKGYGTYGQFDLSLNKEYIPAYFVVAVDEEGTRALSPVYDFSYIEVELCLVTILTDTGICVRDEEGECETDDEGHIITEILTEYGVGIRFENESTINPFKSEIPYYLGQYSSTLSIKCELIDGVDGVVEAEPFEGTDVRYITVDETTYTALYDMLESTSGANVLNKTTVTITDYVGVPHICALWDKFGTKTIPRSVVAE